MNNSSYKSDIQIGILGGGQLGRMLIQEGLNFDLNIHCLDPDVNAPCKNISKTFTVGDLNNFRDVIDFGSDKDVISIEIENVSIEALEKLESDGKKVFPQSRVIKIIKDKGLQKQFYLDNNIPTAEFKLINNKAELSENKAYLPFVQKLRTGGYDGKGVTTHKNETTFENGFDAPSVLEKFVPFVKELSVIVARNEAGECKSFPTVECEFNPDANLVEFLFAPAEISAEIEEKAQKLAVQIIQKLEMVGLLAVELFLTKEGDLLVNEIAPRPHNSGHHTIECNVTSQFEQHLRSILNFPLGDTAIIQAGVMINLLGEENHSGLAVYEGFNEALKFPGVTPHLYGKKETKPFRKMGHVTISNQDLDRAKEIGRQVQKIVRVRT